MECLFAVLLLPLVTAYVSEFNSWDASEFNVDGKMASITSLGGLSAELVFYESSMAWNLDFGTTLSEFAGSHSQFSASPVWQMSGGFGYVGISGYPRGTWSGESNTPAPTGVFDMAMHPPDSDQFLVVEFKAPVEGTYQVYNFGGRRTETGGDCLEIIFFDQWKSEKTRVRPTNDRAWRNDGTTYNLGSVALGQSLYFATSRCGDFDWDASLLSFTVSVDVPDTPGSDCALVWGGHCYFLQSDLLTWDQANTDCQDRGMYLASITSGAEMTEILSFTGGSPAWTGLHGNPYTWSSCERTSWVDIFPLWAANQPSGIADECVAVQPGGLDDQNCGATLAAVCESDRECGLSYGGKCYVIGSTPGTFANAQAECVSWGGYVAVPNTAAEWNFVRDTRNAQIAGNSIWLGYDDIDSEGTFQYYGTNTPIFAGVLWQSGQPDNWNSDEDCVELLPGGDLNDVTCTASFMYLCEEDETLASCSDGVKNGDEQGIDCGTVECGLCPDGEPCGGGEHCLSGFCAPETTSVGGIARVCATYDGVSPIVIQAEEMWTTSDTTEDNTQGYYRACDRPDIAPSTDIGIGSMGCYDEYFVADAVGCYTHSLTGKCDTTVASPNCEFSCGRCSDFEVMETSIGENLRYKIDVPFDADWMFVARVAHQGDGGLIVVETGNDSLDPFDQWNIYDTKQEAHFTNIQFVKFLAAGTYQFVFDIRSSVRLGWISLEPYTPTTPTLAYHWMLDGGSGTEDNLVNPGTFGAVPNGSPSFGTFPNKYYRMDSVDDYFLISGGEGITYDEFSISFWMRTPSFTHHYECVICKGDYSWRISRLDYTGTLLFGMTTTSINDVYPPSISTTDVADGKWHHVLFTRGRPFQVVYIDGVMESTERAIHLPVSTTSAPVGLGHNSDYPSRNFGGSLYDVRIYEGGAVSRENVLKGQFCAYPHVAPRQYTGTVSFDVSSTVSSALNVGAAGNCAVEPPPGNGYWISLLGSGNDITVSNCGSGMDTVILVQTVCGSNCHASADQGCGTGDSSTSVTFPSDLDQEYHVLIGSLVLDSGADMTVTIDYGGSPPEVYLVETSPAFSVDPCASGSVHPPEASTSRANAAVRCCGPSCSADPLGPCLDTSTDFMDAAETCHAAGLQLCDAPTVDCCGATPGCGDLPAWVHRPAEGPEGGGVDVLLSGSNFGADDNPIEIRIGGNLCTTSEWVSSTRAICHGAPPGTGIVNVTVYSSITLMTGSLPSAFTYRAPPSVTSIDPSVGPRTGGTLVTIGGDSFGDALSVLTVTIDGAACTSAVWLASTQIECVTSAMPSFSAAVDVIVTTGASGTSAPAALFTVSFIPAVTRVTPNEGPEAGGGSVTVSGLRFGVGGAPATLECTIDGVACAPVVFIDDETFTCIVPPGTAGLQGVQVTSSASGTSGTALEYTYKERPVVTSLDITVGRADGGNNIVITGDNFGTSNNTVTVRLDGAACASSVWVSDGTVQCWGTPAYASDLPGIPTLQVVTVAAGISPPVYLFSYVAPVVEAVWPPAGKRANSPTSPTTLVLSGEYFGPPSGSVTVGGVSCESLVISTDTSATCELQSNLPASGPHVIRLSSDLTGVDVDTDTYYEAYAEPTILSISPPGGPVDGGTAVDILGRSFGNQSSAVSVMFGAASVACTWMSSSLVKCATPPQAAGDALIELSTALTGSSASASSLFMYYDPPTVISTLPDNGPQSGSTTIAVQGSNFGDDPLSFTIFVADRPCLSSTWMTAGTAECVTPPSGFAGSVNVSVTSSLSGSSPGAPVFLYNVAAGPTSINISEGPLAGGTPVLIQGTNFGGVDNEISITVGNTTCDEAKWVSNSTVTCITGSSVDGPGLQGITVDAECCGSNVVPVDLFTYLAPPSVSDISQTESSEAGFAAPVTITGASFGSEANPVTATVGGLACTDATWLSPTEITCTGIGAAVLMTPPNAGVKDVVVSTQRSGGPSPSAPLFTVNAPPVLLGATPPTGSRSGQRITIAGSHFGFEASAITISVGGQVCTEPEWETPTTVACKVAELPPGPAEVVVDTFLVGGSEAAAIYSVNPAPLVTAVVPAAGPQSGGQRITISGVGFGPDDGSIVARIGEGRCGFALWLSNTSFSCVTPPGSQGAPGVIVAAVRVGSSDATAGVYAYSPLPTVSSAAPAEGPMAGGREVVFTGLSFGAVNNTVSVLIGGSACAGAVWRSPFTVSCTTPPALVSGPAWMVVTTKLTDTSGVATVYTYSELPIVTAAIPQEGPAVGGTRITLSGSNFGLTGNIVSVDIDGSPCTGTLRGSESTISCETTAHAPGIPNITVTSALTGTATSSGTLFRYNELPTVTGVSPSVGPAYGGLPVTVTGSSFGSSFNALTIYFGGVPCLSSAWLGPATARCSLPPGAAASSVTISIQSDLAGGPGPAGSLFSYGTDPTIATVVPTEGPLDGGRNITISGANFGPIGSSLSLTIGGAPANWCEWQSENDAVCETGPSTSRIGLKGVVIESSATGRSRPAFQYTYNRPPALEIDLENEAPLAGGDTVRFKGRGFGPPLNPVTVTIDNVECASSLIISREVVECVTPPGGSVGVKDVGVSTLLTGDATPKDVFAYAGRPTISGITPAMGPHTGGQVVEISGDHFGRWSHEDVAVSIGGASCDATWMSPTTIACMTGPIAAGSVGPASVEVTSSVFATSLPSGDIYTYDTAVLSYIKVNALFEDGSIKGAAGTNSFSITTYDQYGVLRDVPGSDDIHLNITNNTIAVTASTFARTAFGEYSVTYVVSEPGVFHVSVRDSTAGVLFTNTTTISSGVLDEVRIDSPRSSVDDVVEFVAGSVVLIVTTLDNFGNVRSQAVDDASILVEIGESRTALVMGTLGTPGTYSIAINQTTAGDQPLRMCSPGTLPGGTCDDLQNQTVRVLGGPPATAAPSGDWSSHVAGSVSLTAHTFDAYGNPSTGYEGMSVTVTTRGPAPLTASTSASGAAFDDGSSDITATLFLPIAGDYIVDVAVDGAVILRGNTTIIPGEPFPGNTVASGVGLSETVAGVFSSAFLQFADQYNNLIKSGSSTLPFPLVADLHYGSTILSDMGDFTQIDDSIVNLEYRTTRASPIARLFIFVDGVNILGSPFTVNIHPGATHAPSSTLIVPSTIIAGEASPVVIEARDRYSNLQETRTDGPWSVHLLQEGSTADVVFSNSSVITNGKYEVLITLTVAGMYGASASLDGVASTTTMPFSVRPAPPHIPSTQVTGWEVEVANHLGVSFTFRLVDRFDNFQAPEYPGLPASFAWTDANGTSGDVAVEHVGGGIYNCTYNITHAGPAALVGDVGGAELTLNPLIVAAETDGVMCTVTGLGVDGPVLSNQTAEFLVTTYDSYGNSRDEGGDLVAVVVSLPSDTEINVEMIDDTPGKYRGSLVGTDERGTMLVTVEVNQVPLADSPFRVESIGRCVPGTFQLPLGGCQECDRGTYTSRDNMESCSVCPAGTTTFRSGRGARDCECGFGFFLINPVPGVACEECPSGARCPGGATPPRANPGFYPGNTPGTVVACRNQACVGEGVCAPGYEGYMCSKCADNYYEFANECRRCSSGAMGLMFLAVFALFAAVTTITVLNVGDSGHSRLTCLRIGFNSIQMSALFAGMDVEWPIVTQTLMDIIAFANLNFEISAPECSVAVANAFILKHYVTLFLPFICAFMLVLVFGLGLLRHRLLAKDLPPEPPSTAAMGTIVAHGFKRLLHEDIGTAGLRDACLRSMNQILVIVYLPVVTQTLAYIDCNLRGGAYIVDSAPSFMCYSSQWYSHLWVSVLGIIFYIVGIPALVVGVLVAKKRSLDPVRFHLSFGFLTRAYEDKYYWWEVTIMMRKALVAGCMIFLNNDNRNSQFAAAIIVVHVFTMTHHFLDPFASRLHNRVEAISLINATGVLFCGLVFLGKTQHALFDFSVSLLLVSSVGVVVYGFAKDIKEWRATQKELGKEEEDLEVTVATGMGGARSVVSDNGCEKCLIAIEAGHDACKLHSVSPAASTNSTLPLGESEATRQQRRLSADESLQSFDHLSVPTMALTSASDSSLNASSMGPATAGPGSLDSSLNIPPPPPPPPLHSGSFASDADASLSIGPPPPIHSGAFASDPASPGRY